MTSINLAERLKPARFLRSRRVEYWLVIALANLVGHVPSHILRHGAYRHIFRIRLPENSVIYMGCRFFNPWGIAIGHNSIVGDHAFLDGRRGLVIGNNVNIAGDVRIYTLEHDPSSLAFEAVGGPVELKDWVYIGTRVTILPGVTIGEGAVVASGAVVTQSVQPWTIVGGVPAKYIKNRPIVRYELNTGDKALFQ